MYDHFLILYQGWNLLSFKFSLVLNFQDCVKRLTGCFSLGEYFQASISVSNFTSLYLHAENIWYIQYVSLRSSSNLPNHMKFYVNSYYKTLILKAYNKIRRATDIISHSLSERRSIFYTSWWSKLSNGTGCFTACIGVHSCSQVG